MMQGHTATDMAQHVCQHEQTEEQNIMLAHLAHPVMLSGKLVGLLRGCRK